MPYCSSICLLLFILPYHGMKRRQRYAEAKSTQFDILKYREKITPYDMQTRGILVLGQKTVFYFSTTYFSGLA